MGELLAAAIGFSIPHVIEIIHELVRESNSDRRITARS